MEYLEKVPMFFPQLAWDYKYPLMIGFFIRGLYVYNQCRKQLYEATPAMHSLVDTCKYDSLIPQGVYEHIEKAKKICEQKYGKTYSIIPVIEVAPMFSRGSINSQGTRDTPGVVIGIEPWVLKEFTPDEIGAVVYHEVQHVINNDSVRSMRFKAIFPSLQLFGGLAGYKIGQSTALIDPSDAFVLTFVVGGLLECAWARRKEMEADKGVMQTRDEKVITSFISCLNKLEKKVDKETFFPIPTFLSFCPSFKQRITACDQALRELQVAGRP